MPETPELADEAGVKIFSADIIYHLFDQFKAYTDNFKEEKKKEASEEAVYPCVLQIMPNCVFKKGGLIVLVVDVVEGIAKVDRLYGWKVCRSAPLVKAMKQQSKDVQIEFNAKLTQVITQLKEQGLNTKLYYRNKEMGETYSTVPTCAISGEGIPDLLSLLVQWTQETMIEKLTYSNEVQV